MCPLINIQPFDETNSFTVIPAATQVIFTITVPPKCILRIKKFANYTDTPAAIGTGLTWSIQRNGIPIIRYGLILDLLGQSWQPEDIVTDTFKGGDVLSIVTVNGTAGNVISGARITFDLEGVR